MGRGGEHLLEVVVLVVDAVVVAVAVVVELQ